MISIPAAVEAAIKKRPFLEDALVEGLINLSALARGLKPEIESVIGRDANDSAIIMALNRLIPKLGAISARKIGDVVENIGDITVRSNMAVYTFVNSATLHQCLTELTTKIDDMKNIFITFSQGVYETTLVVSESAAHLINDIFQNEHKTAENRKLSLITTKLPSNNAACPGVYYYLFKELAWENINIVEVISTTNEFSIVANDNDIHRAFAILMNSKQHGVRMHSIV